MNKKMMVLLIASLALLQCVHSQTLHDRILSLPGVISVEKMVNNPFFSESYIIMIKQPLDHQKPEEGYFPQRVILSHLDYKEPVVFVTEGYNADAEVGPRYLNELCPLLYANQVFAEHRFFGKSIPDPIKWKYLTVENAAADHHHIAELFKKIYQGKWIGTGISKGGQTSLYYRLLYPNDVAGTVAYVAPLNFSVEEKRHDRFIRHKTGNAEERKAVMNFQREVLKRKAELLPEFESYCKDKKYVFKAPISEIYDYCVLEYSFSFWQWCHSVKEIPSSNSTNNDIFHYFVKVISPDYFDVVSGRTVMPFFVQAERQLGYYAYNPKPFKDLMQLKNTKGYIAKLFIPEDAVFPYDPYLSIQLQKFLRNKAENILLIYGENDPWTASSAKKGRNKKVIKIIMKNGCHLARINTLTKEQQDLSIGTIKAWLN
jgi:hypothetical protein